MPILATFIVPHPPLIIPEIGGDRIKTIEKTVKAYETVAEEIASLKPETIVITSPHSVMYADCFHISPGKEAKGSFKQFDAPGVKFHEEYDTNLVKKIEEISNNPECIQDAREGGYAFLKSDYYCTTLGEKDSNLDHGTMVPLFFIRQKYKEGKIVRIGLSGLPYEAHYLWGEIITKATEDLGRKIVIVASGDLSHKLQEYGPYGFAEEGVEYDKRIMDVCKRAAFDEMLEFDDHFCDRAAECGHKSFIIM
ncbi:MAG: AmmeMemoRadiSam system protein B, partial [Lachnospiraceae bacterium]|nr:AmmeMemoRadiSam system protein B [Lachnospiraceae bacterium]